MRDYLGRMFRYMAWADRRTLEAVCATPAAHAEALPLLAHLFAAEHVWLCRLSGRNPMHPVWPTLGLDACAALAEENEAGYRDLLAGLTDGRLAEIVRYRTSQGQEWASSVLDMLTQVITHGPYHRGQIAKVVGRHGGTATNTDYILFVLTSEPAS